MAERTTTGDQPDKYSAENAFLLQDLLPDASDAYAADVRDIGEAVKDADVVLDTNVLLIPYGAGTASLSAITAVYDSLVSGKRLYLPAQVVREFIKNRPRKISELLQGISNKISRVLPPGELSYPILEGLSAYADLQRAAAGIAEGIKELKKANGEMLRTIRS